MDGNRLTRDTDNAMLGGVCAGLARTYGFDVTVVRIVWLVVTIFSMGTGIVLYIAAWVIMPRPDEVGGPPPQDRGQQHRPPPPGAPLPARERFVESGRVLISHARRSAEEIADIARGNPTGASASGGAPTSADESSAPPPNKAGTTDSGAPAGGSEQMNPPQPGTSQPFTPGDTPTSADPPTEENPPPPPQSPV